MIEEWRPVRDYDGMYEVSNLGRVRSLDREKPDKNGRMVKRKGKILSTFLFAGKIAFKVSKNCEHKFLYVSREVLKSFCPHGYEKELIAKHLSGSITDCRLSNLVWDSKNIPIEEKIRKIADKRGALNYEMVESILSLFLNGDTPEVISCKLKVSIREVRGTLAGEYNKRHSLLTGKMDDVSLLYEKKKNDFLDEWAKKNLKKFDCFINEDISKTSLVLAGLDRARANIVYDYLESRRG